MALLHDNAPDARKWLWLTVAVIIIAVSILAFHFLRDNDYSSSQETATYIEENSTDSCSPSHFLGEPDETVAFKDYNDVREYLEENVFANGGKTVELLSSGYCVIDSKKISADLKVTKFDKNTAQVVAVCHDQAKEVKIHFTVDALNGTLHDGNTTYSLQDYTP